MKFEANKEYMRNLSLHLHAWFWIGKFNTKFLRWTQKKSLPSQDCVQFSCKNEIVKQLVNDKC